MAKKRRSRTLRVKLPPWALIILVVIIIVVALFCFGNNYFGWIKNRTSSTTTVTTATTENSESNVSTTVYSGTDQVNVYYIDIGSTGGDPGEASLIKTPTYDILIDSGQNDSYTKASLLSFLKSYVSDGVIEYAIVTHPDSDHVGGMLTVYANFQVTNTIRYAGTGTTKTATNFEAKAAEASTVTEITSYFETNNATFALNLDSGVDLLFLNTKTFTASDANAKSIVFVLEAYNSRILFTGDAEESQEKNYAAACGNVDVLKMGHHGSQYATTASLLTAVDPEVVIATNGDFLGNEYKHPTYEAVSRVYTYDSKIYVYATTGGDWENDLDGDSDFDLNDRAVDRNGTIVIVCSSSGYNVSRLDAKDLIELSTTHYWIDALNPYSTLKHSDN